MAQLGLFTARIGSALVYIGSARKNPHRAVLKEANCRIFKTFLMKAGEECELYLKPSLSRGSISIDISDAAKHPVLCLNEGNRSGVLRAADKCKYKLVFRFDNATGSFTFGWR